MSDSREIRAAKIFSTLKELFPEIKMALRYSNNWELLVAVILSAQCTDKRVNEITKELFIKYQSPRDFANAKQNTLEKRHTLCRLFQK